MHRSIFTFLSFLLFASSLTHAAEPMPSTEMTGALNSWPAPFYHDGVSLEGATLHDFDIDVGLQGAYVKEPFGSAQPNASVLSSAFLASLRAAAQFQYFGVHAQVPMAIWQGSTYGVQENSGYAKFGDLIFGLKLGGIPLPKWVPQPAASISFSAQIGDRPLSAGQWRAYPALILEQQIWPNRLKLIVNLRGALGIANAKECPSFAPDAPPCTIQNPRGLGNQFLYGAGLAFTPKDDGQIRVLAEVLASRTDASPQHSAVANFAVRGRAGNNSGLSWQLAAGFCLTGNCSTFYVTAGLAYYFSQKDSKTGSSPFVSTPAVAAPVPVFGPAIVPSH